MAKYRMYDFLCRDCGHQFEETVDVDFDGGIPPISCPQCDSRKTEKLPNAAAGYSGSFGGGSTSPKGRGSFKRSGR